MITIPQVSYRVSWKFNFLEWEDVPNEEILWELGEFESWGVPDLSKVAQVVLGSTAKSTTSWRLREVTCGLIYVSSSESSSVSKNSVKLSGPSLSSVLPTTIKSYLVLFEVYFLALASSFGSTWQLFLNLQHSFWSNICCFYCLFLNLFLEL